MEEMEQPVIETEEAADLEESAPSEEIEEVEESGEEATAEPPKSKGVQKRIDELVRQREEERRRADRLEEAYLRMTQKPHEEPEAKPAPQFPDLPPVPPDRYAFDSDEEYGQAVQTFQRDNAAFVQGQISKAREAAQEEHSQTQREKQLRTGLAGLVQKGNEAHPDFGQVAFIPQGLEDVFLDADNGPELAYYLGKNPQEVQRLLNLSPSKAAFEIARLDAKMAKQPKPTSAPPPIRPVGGNEPAAFDPATCTADEYRAWRKKQQG